MWHEEAGCAKLNPSISSNSRSVLSNDRKWEKLRPYNHLLLFNAVLASHQFSKLKCSRRDSWLSCSWTAAESYWGNEKKKKKVCVHAEDSIQRPKANGCVRHFGWWCGNSPYLTCKFLQELKEPEKQVSKEVCCCVGEGGRADGWVWGRWTITQEAFKYCS